MKKFLPLLVLPAAAVLSGCYSTHTAGHSAGLKGVSVALFQPDVEIGKKISGEATVNEILGFIYLGADKQADGVDYKLKSEGAGGLLSFISGSGAGGVDKAKAAAAYEAITKNEGTDLLVAPTYIVNTEDFFVFKRHTAKVSALQGTIKKVKQEKFDGGKITDLDF